MNEKTMINKVAFDWVESIFYGFRHNLTDDKIEDNFVYKWATYGYWSEEERIDKELAMQTLKDLFIANSKEIREIFSKIKLDFVPFEMDVAMDVNEIDRITNAQISLDIKRSPKSEIAFKVLLKSTLNYRGNKELADKCRLGYFNPDFKVLNPNAFQLNHYNRTVDSYPIYQLNELFKHFMINMDLYGTSKFNESLDRFSFFGFSTADRKGKVHTEFYIGLNIDMYCVDPIK